MKPFISQYAKFIGLLFSLSILFIAGTQAGWCHHGHGCGFFNYRPRCNGNWNRGWGYGNGNRGWGYGNRGWNAYRNNYWGGGYSPLISNFLRYRY